MKEHQFVDRYAELNPRYIKHKQDQYKNYYQEELSLIPYTEELFWDKLIHLGWRKDHTTTECLVLVCPACEKAITKVVLKDNIDIRPLLKIEDKVKIHKTAYCKAIAKQGKAIPKEVEK
jgi:hypothetical protein